MVRIEYSEQHGGLVVLHHTSLFFHQVDKFFKIYSALILEIKSQLFLRKLSFIIIIIIFIKFITIIDNHRYH